MGSMLLLGAGKPGAVAAPTISSFTPTSQVQGMTVVITGTNFTGASAVTFGGTNAASFNVDSPTQITATLGAGASGSVAVTTAGGTGTKSGFTFTDLSIFTVWHKLNEADGATRKDYLGSEDLTAQGTGTIHQSAGINGGAHSTAYNVAFSQYHNRADDAALRTGTGAFIEVINFRASTLTGYLFSKDSSTAAGRLIRIEGGGVLRVIIRQSSGATCASITSAVNLSTATDYQAILYYDPAQTGVNKVGLIINGGAAEHPASVTGTPADETAPFEINNDSTNAGSPVTVELADHGFAKGGTFTAGIGAALWNGGTVIRPQGSGNWGTA